ncbi:amidase [Halovulum dunhuangense]|uniref:Amidase n=1 Tax=Halovulum dunhuangense TaxID=1505036 RepID=A0A849L3H6_9RHOB|nr:amidase [Halovulum dunhuangense]NNU80865.1 amidase [Halovulum dunhuangense]
MAGKPKTDALLDLDACTLRDRIASGALRAVQLAEAYLERVKEREPQVQAFAWHDPEFVMHQARELDRFRATGRAIGPLHGIPVALKDVIDTVRIPTENGTVLDQGRIPVTDAFVVAQLKKAGAIIMGKTVTTELAFLSPGKTVNPHDPAHTPGGSSSGSAAAVAAGMVPLAVGTQTGGSVIRPAAFCGVTGFKPSFGLIPRTGVLMQSHTLDTLGVFARTPADAALLADALAGYDALDKATSMDPHPRLLDTTLTEPPVKPTLAFVRPPGWADAEPQTRAAIEELAEALGEQAFWVDLPPAFNEAAALRERINFAEMAKYYYRYARQGLDKLAPVTREAIEKGSAITARDYLAALDWREVLHAGLGEIFERCDAIVTPAAPGPAPEGLGSTGNAIFNGLWTYVGTPSVTVPLLQAENGLPMGVQLCGPRSGDARLLRTARWLVGWAAQQDA